MKSVKLAIIILNWNNPKDTLACLKSVLSSELPKDTAIILTDNGSTDDSLTVFSNFFISHYVETTQVSYTKTTDTFEPALLDSQVTGCRLILLENNENFGFAKGNNLAIRLSQQLNPEWILLLNNDTEVEPDTFTNLLDCAAANPSVKLMTPVITFYDRPDLIWNAGGKLTWWGDRLYIGAKKSRQLFPIEGIRPISFVTGCALLAHHSVLKPHGLLTEQFFFGEEDYFLSREAKKNRWKMAVCWSSEIKHKVSSSIKKVSPKSVVPMVYIHHLNRIINMKNWLPVWVFPIWKPFYLLYAVFMLWWKRWIPIPVLLIFTKLVWVHSAHKTEVTRDDFFGAKGLFNE